MEAPAPIHDSIPRIFVVGMNKTGTSTMKGCLESLGWNPVASPTTVKDSGRLFNAIIRHYDYESALDIAHNYLGFEDRPWNVWEMYRRAADRFPDSNFILTRREPDTWWRSVFNWLTAAKPHMVETYRIHLRAEHFTESEFVRAYERHNEEIVRFFEGTGRLLTLDVTSGDGWEQICPFLGVPVPDEPFPHRNRQRY